MSGRTARRRKRKRRRRNAMLVGACAVAAQALLGVVVPLLMFSGDVDRYGPLIIFSSVVTLAVSFFVYFGASRLYAPELPMALVQLQHGHTSSGDAVVLHTGTKFRTASRRRSLVALGVGVGAWALATAAFGLSLARDSARDSRDGRERDGRAAPSPTPNRQ